MGSMSPSAEDSPAGQLGKLEESVCVTSRATESACVQCDGRRRVWEVRPDKPALLTAFDSSVPCDFSGASTGKDLLHAAHQRRTAR